MDSRLSLRPLLSSVPCFTAQKAAGAGWCGDRSEDLPPSKLKSPSTGCPVWHKANKCAGDKEGEQPEASSSTHTSGDTEQGHGAGPLGSRGRMTPSSGDCHPSNPNLKGHRKKENRGNGGRLPCLSPRHVGRVPRAAGPARAATFLPRPGKGSDLAAGCASCVPNCGHKREKSLAEKRGLPF